MNAVLKVAVSDSNFENISVKELRKNHKRLNDRGVKGLTKFCVAEDIMQQNPGYFADELAHALDVHFGIVTVISTR